MTLPSDIPEDIQRAALKAFHGRPTPCEPEDDHLVVRIARALLAERAAAEQRGAEREREACVAEAYRVAELTYNDAYDVAAAIRGRKA